MVFNGMIVTPYVTIVAAIVGLVMGSFVNCWAWRYLRGESVVTGRSHCTSCGHDLAARDLVPVFSWLFSRGRCRYCGQKVSARYPITELVCAAVFAAIAYVYGLSWETAELLLFCCVLLFLTLTDVDAFLIPNGCIVVALLVRVAYLALLWFTGKIELYGVLFYVGSAVGVGAVLLLVVLVADRILGRESMGGGDLKLYVVAGFYFGWMQTIYLVVLSCLIGIFVGLLRPGKQEPAPEESADAEPDEDEPYVPGQLFGPPRDEPVATQGQPAAASENEPPRRLSQPFPFGPSIAVACVITMLIGEPFVSWYLSLL